MNQLHPIFMATIDACSKAVQLAKDVVSKFSVVEADMIRAVAYALARHCDALVEAIDKELAGRNR